MPIKVMKSTRSNEDIKAICNFMQINDNHNIEIYMGKNIQEDFKNIYGYKFDISAGLFVEPVTNKGNVPRIFIEGDDPLALIHELQHYRFNRNCIIFGKNKLVLHFIDEYLAKFYETLSKLTALKQVFTIESVIQEAKETMLAMDEFMNNKADSDNINKQIEYMSRIATLLAWRKILVDLNQYDKSLDLIRDISHFTYDVFGSIDWNNINQEIKQYRKIESEYTEYVNKHYNIIIS